MYRGGTGANILLVYLFVCPLRSLVRKECGHQVTTRRKDTAMVGSLWSGHSCIHSLYHWVQETRLSVCLRSLLPITISHFKLVHTRAPAHTHTNTCTHYGPSTCPRTEPFVHLVPVWRGHLNTETRWAVVVVVGAYCIVLYCWMDGRMDGSWSPLLLPYYDYPKRERTEGPDIITLSKWEHCPLLFGDYIVVVVLCWWGTSWLLTPLLQGRALGLESIDANYTARLKVRWGIHKARVDYTSVSYHQAIHFSRLSKEEEDTRHSRQAIP